jgi:hypothetical protein
MKTFYIQHGQAPGPFRTEAVEAKESIMIRPTVRGSVFPCRFLVKYAGRWHRLYSQHGVTHPHFIVSGGERLIVTGVCP